MGATHALTRRYRNRNPLLFSVDYRDERRRDGLLRESWGRITSAFKAKPAPTSSWYETATGDFTPWRYVVEPIRAAILAALNTGDSELLRVTLEGARAFCRELEADFCSLVPALGEKCVITLSLQETHAQGVADVPQMELVKEPTPQKAASAVVPLERHYNCLGDLLDGVRCFARQAVTPWCADSARTT